MTVIYFLNQEHLKSRPLSSTQRGLNVCQSTLERFRHAKTLLSDVLPMQKQLAINFKSNSKNKVIEELQSNLRNCSRYSSKVEVEGNRESDQLVSSRKSKSAGQKSAALLLPGRDHVNTSVSFLNWSSTLCSIQYRVI